MIRFLTIIVILVCFGFAAFHLPARSQPPEKAAPAKPVVAAKPSEETLEMLYLLNQTIDTKGLQEKVKLKTALEYFSDKFGGKLPILIDREAFIAANGADAADPYEEEVSLPPVPSRMPMSLALRLVLAQVANGQATYVVRKTYFEIVPVQLTTAPHALRQSIPFRTFDQKPLPEVLGDLGEMNSLAINLDPTVGKKGTLPISATFRNCSLEEALVTVTEMAELKFVVLEHSVYVTTSEKAIVLRKEEDKRAADRKELKLLPRRLAPAF